MACITVNFSHLNYSILKHGCEAIVGNFVVSVRNCLVHTLNYIVNHEKAITWQFVTDKKLKFCWKTDRLVLKQISSRRDRVKFLPCFIVAAPLEYFRRSSCVILPWTILNFKETNYQGGNLEMVRELQWPWINSNLTNASRQPVGHFMLQTDKSIDFETKLPREFTSQMYNFKIHL